MAVGTVIYQKPSGYLFNPQSVVQQIVTQETKTLKGICPEIDEILKDTFGCIIYQEQVMSIVHRVFHMTMGEADMFRRAIGKKDPELMKKMIEKLKKMDSGLDADQVERVVKTIGECSGYIFNKCLVGSEVILGIGNTRKYTIKEMYLLKNDKDYARSRKLLSTYTMYNGKRGFGGSYSLANNEGVKNSIKDIYYSGFAMCVKITTEQGSVSCTLNHKFPTPNGERFASELKVGDELFYLGSPRCGDKPVLTTKIISIECIGEQEVYSVEMENPYHTFTLKNRIITSNSHSSAYAKTAYQTAYLKTYFPREFYCALLNSNIKNDKMVEYISEARNANIEILPPSYPESDKKWTIHNGRLRFGLEKIKNVGNCNICYNNEEITDIEHGGLLKAFCDLNSTINKQVPIAMAKAGCFQCSPLWCIEYIEWFKNYYTRVMQIRERLEKYKDNPKKVVEWEQKMNELTPPPEYFETSLEEEIAMQNEVLGMAFKSILDVYDMTLADRFFNIVGGVVKDIKKKTIKNGKPMYLIDLDENGITRGYTLFGENTNKVAIGDVVLVKKNKPNPYAKSHFDRTVISDIMKATKK